MIKKKIKQLLVNLINLKEDSAREVLNIFIKRVD